MSDVVKMVTTVIVVRDKAERYIKGVYASEVGAKRDILGLYGIYLDEDATKEAQEEVLDNFEFLEFEVEN